MERYNQRHHDQSTETMNRNSLESARKNFFISMSDIADTGTPTPPPTRHNLFASNSNAPLSGSASGSNSNLSNGSMSSAALEVLNRSVGSKSSKLSSSSSSSTSSSSTTTSHVAQSTSSTQRMSSLKSSSSSTSSSAAAVKQGLGEMQSSIAEMKNMMGHNSSSSSTTTTTSSSTQQSSSSSISSSSTKTAAASAAATLASLQSRKLSANTLSPSPSSKISDLQKRLRSSMDSLDDPQGPTDPLVTFPDSETDDDLSSIASGLKPMSMVVPNGHGSLVNGTSSGSLGNVDTVKFEQKKMTSESKTKLVKDGFSSEQATLNSAESKKLHAGDLQYQEQAALAAMSTRTEVDGVTAEEKGAILKQHSAHGTKLITRQQCSGSSGPKEQLCQSQRLSSARNRSQVVRTTGRV
ncbi:sarm1 [Anopheles darlingi]|uniref:Sarm1 n=1 Tax=Anopheles darlingi TaxID=43151 RepID=W5J238_ANODA|nr:sarm1 [Anopheles darlingi]